MVIDIMGLYNIDVPTYPASSLGSPLFPPQQPCSRVTSLTRRQRDKLKTSKFISSRAGYFILFAARKKNKLAWKLLKFMTESGKI
jgi:hypothetical protein